MPINAQFSTKHESPNSWDIPSSPPLSRGRREVALREWAGQHARNTHEYITVEGNTIKYGGPGNDESQTATIRSVEPIPEDCPIYYFEAEVIAKGTTGYIGIGLQGADVALHKLPGWERNSYGYHGDDGKVFHGSGTGRPYGHTYGDGDVIGAALDRVAQTLTFYKNGMCLGVAFTDVTNEPLYPCAGFQSGGATMRVNLGWEPWRYSMSVEMLREERRAVLCQEVSATPPPGGARALYGSAALLAVLSHLVHDCCWRTAQAMVQAIVARGAAGEPPQAVAAVDVHEMCVRQRIRQLIVDGNILEAQKLTEELCPGMLRQREDVNFRLHLQAFVELLRGTCTAEQQVQAVQFARKTIGDLDKTVEQRTLMQEALTLVAYSNPSEAPSADLLKQERRDECAELVNGAIMAYHDRPQCSVLESIYRQLTAVHQEMQQRGCLAPQVLSVEQVLRSGLSAELSFKAEDGATTMSE